MRNLFIVLTMLLLPLSAARAEVSVGIGFSAPGVSIGINLPVYPRLVAVPGYPVYYDPALDYNYFFYDGLYWVLEGDDWYASSWYNGPWYQVQRFDVPLYLLRVPVRYYRRPPAYFRGWRADTAPRWGDHWGRDWEQRRQGWDRSDRRSAAPRRAPLPTYQRKYSGDRYPQQQEQQHSIQTRRYRYQPHEPVTQQYYQQQQPQQQRQPQRRQDRSQDNSQDRPQDQNRDQRRDDRGRDRQ